MLNKKRSAGQTPCVAFGSGVTRRVVGHLEVEESLTIASQRNAGALSVLLFIRFSPAWLKRGCSACTRLHQMDIGIRRTLAVRNSCISEQHRSISYTNERRRLLFARQASRIRRLPSYFAYVLT